MGPAFAPRYRQARARAGPHHGRRGRARTAEVPRRRRGRGRQAFGDDRRSAPVGKRGRSRHLRVPRGDGRRPRAGLRCRGARREPAEPRGRGARRRRGVRRRVRGDGRRVPRLPRRRRAGRDGPDLRRTHGPGRLGLRSHAEAVGGAGTKPRALRHRAHRERHGARVRHRRGIEDLARLDHGPLHGHPRRRRRRRRPGREP